MATFYFNEAVDSDWQTLGNWWMSYNAGTDTHSVPATALPTSTDSIEVRGNITSNSGSEPTVVNAAFFGVAYNEIGITVTGDCTFNDSSYNNSGTITGNCTFNDSSFNSGTITGNCTFNYSAYNYFSAITGDCTFNDSSYNNSGTITGNCTFNDSSFNSGTITGVARFRPSSAGVMIAGTYGGAYGSVEIMYDKGINGSSILGVV